MVVYFVATRVTGIIGIFTSILSALYTVTVGFILNFIIQRTRGSDLRIRIASRGGSMTLLREYYAAGRRMWGGRHSILFAVVILTFSGNVVPFIVNTGIKAGMGMVPQGSLRTWVTTFMSEESGLIFQSRQNSSDFLQSLFNDNRHASVDSDFYHKYPRVDFKVQSEAKEGTISSVNVHFEGAIAPDHPVPGTISLTRQLYTFSQNDTPSCEAMSTNCELMSMRSTISAGADYTKLFDTPWAVTYNDHQGNSISIANLTSATGMANSNRDYFISERPTTLIFGYNEDNGQSVLASFTTASFSCRIDPHFKWNMSQDGLIGSWNRLYQPIRDALNASAFSPPLIGTTAGSKATLVYNTPRASSDNFTHITCVGYEANTSFEDQQENRVPSAVNMVSCRELHIAVMTNTGAAPKPDPEENYLMFKIYNAMAPNQVSNEDIGWKAGENITAVALDMTEFLRNITERIYPFTSMNLAQVQVFDLKEGISFEQWSLVFIGALVGIVVLLYGLDWWLVDEVFKADVLTLIETTSIAGVGNKPASRETMTKKEKKEAQKRWSKRKYPAWSLETDGAEHHVLLRGERVLAKKPAERQRLKTRDFA